MPNWCSNSIEISGETEKIDRIRTILSLREDNDDMFFKPLLGQTDDENWYDDNINNLGTKWDVSVSKDNFYTESEIGMMITSTTLGLSGMSVLVKITSILNPKMK